MNHPSINRDERAADGRVDLSPGGPCLKPASTVSSRAKWFKSELDTRNWRKESKSVCLFVCIAAKPQVMGPGLTNERTLSAVA
jgi:hypothetical protein